MPDVTAILNALSRGEASAAELWPVVYDELRHLAGQLIAREKAGQTLDATALVHEAYLRLCGTAGDSWANRRHFFAACAESMRRILIDRARARQADKRGGQCERSAVELDQLAARYCDEDMLAVDSLLDGLAGVDAEAAELTRLHVFGGLSIEEAGAALGLARATAYRNWSFARAWLRAALSLS
jgi:RNA polymerase sigma factor (TIGR02999 family)